MQLLHHQCKPCTKIPKRNPIDMAAGAVLQCAPRFGGKTTGDTGGIGGRAFSVVKGVGIAKLH